MIINIQPLDDIIEEVIPLVEDHHNEIDQHLQSIGCHINPSYDTYFYLADIGKLTCITAREDDGYLIGYLFVLVDEHFHYKDKVWATVDLVYVDPGYRNAGVAKSMFAYLQSEVECNYIAVAEKVEHPMRGLLTHLGFKPLELTYIKKV